MVSVVESVGSAVESVGSVVDFESGIDSEVPLTELVTKGVGDLDADQVRVTEVEVLAEADTEVGAREWLCETTGISASSS